MCLEQKQQEHKPRSKNTNPEIKIQKLKISKSPFSQTQQNHQILKPQSTKLIQKYNTTNPNKKNLKLKTTHQPPHLKQTTNPRTITMTKPPINHKLIMKLKKKKKKKKKKKPNPEIKNIVQDLRKNIEKNTHPDLK